MSGIAQPHFFYGSELKAYFKPQTKQRCQTNSPNEINIYLDPIDYRVLKSAKSGIVHIAMKFGMTKAMTDSATQKAASMARNVF